MSSVWRDACTLEERRQAYLRYGWRAFSYDRSLAQSRLERWLAAPCFLGREKLQRRLSAESLTLPDFQNLLGIRSESIPEPLFPAAAWESRLIEAYDTPAYRQFRWPDGVDPEKIDRGFFSLLQPLLNRYAWQFDDKAKALAAAVRSVPFDAASVTSLFWPSLLSRLFAVTWRVLVVEANVFRLQRSGEDPASRFRSYLRRLSEPETQNEILRRYPVLARGIIAAAEEWLAGSLEFLQRLHLDFEQLKEVAGAESMGVLKAIRGNAGDLHGAGRSVLIAAFDGEARLVYKPHTLAIDQHFQEFVRWLNAEGLEPALAPRRVWDRGEYGWTEYSPVAPCRSPDEVERFFRRQGSWLAIFYALAGTDLHYENVVASGEHPCLVDLETLFQPRLFPLPEPTADSVAREILRDSVLSVGLLPAPRAGEPALDTSGLGANENDEFPFESWQASDWGTDQVHVVRKRGRLGKVHNRASFRGNAADPRAYLDSIESGFTQTYRLLARQRSRLLSPGGILDRFAADRTRVVLRGTHIYARLIMESYHPQVLRDAIERDLLADHLWASADLMPGLNRVIASEKRQVLSGSVPYFSARVGEKDLAAADGVSFPSALTKSGLTVARERILSLGEEDLDRQIGFLRSSLADGKSGREKVPSAAPEIPDPLSAARGIGERLGQLALWKDDAVSWLTVHPQAGAGVVGNDLYSGLPGVIFFLSYLQRELGEPKFERLIEGALSTFERRRAVGIRLPFIGGFNGQAGLIHFWTHLAVLRKDPALFDRAVTLLAPLAEGIGQDSVLDVIGGCAGCVTPLLALHRYRPESSAKALAIRCGERILSLGRAAANGWELPIKAKRGFSHGPAGIAWALSELAAETGEARFHDVALAVNRHEQTLIGGGKWSDETHLFADGAPQQHWCHGAPGIALARLAQYRRAPSLAVREDAFRALDATLLAPLPDNHSLCHGALGNLEPLVFAAELFPDEIKWRIAAKRQIDRILSGIGQGGHLDGVGLMTGLSGAGYGLLRLACPGRIPSVLLLEPPVEI